jgi:hypothetical protein
MEVFTMKLIGQLKNKVEKAETKEEAMKIIREAGMLLDDQEMDQVIGGLDSLASPHLSIAFARE